jgi:hypothetical protein
MSSADRTQISLKRLTIAVAAHLQMMGYAPATTEGVRLELPPTEAMDIGILSSNPAGKRFRPWSKRRKSNLIAVIHPSRSAITQTNQLHFDIYGPANKEAVERVACKLSTALRVDTHIDLGDFQPRTERLRRPFFHVFI